MTRSSSRDPALSRARIIASLAANPGLSRKDLADRLQLGRGTVTEQVRRLIRAGIVSELPADVQGAGRPRVPLTIDDGAGYTLGVDIEPDRVVLIEASMTGSVLRTATVPFEPGSPSHLSALAKIIGQRLDDPVGGACTAIGVALSGVVRGPTVMVSVVLGWRHEHLGDELEDLLGQRVWLANDMEALSALEDVRAQDDSNSSFLIVALGAGVGMAVVVGDRSERGIGGKSVEFGHVSVDPSGPICGCGNRGCIETYVATQDLVRRIADRDSSVSGRATLEAAVTSTAAPSVLADSAYRLGRAIGGALTLTGTSRVVLTGEDMSIWRPHAQQIMRGVTDTTPTLVTPSKLSFVPWSPTSVAAGAAVVALSRTLADSIPLRDKADRERELA